MDLETLKALSDENRLRIVQLLSERGELCVCDLAAVLEMSDALVSHHVKQLREAGLVRTRRIGRWLHCSLDTLALDMLAAGFASLSSRASQAASAAARACCVPTGGADAAYPTVKEEIWP